MKNYKIVSILLSLFVGVFVFITSEYKSSTLNIDARSTEKGIGTVFFDGEGFNVTSNRNFQIKDDQGKKKLYVIELPASKLKSLKIVSRIPVGTFGIERIIFANDAISYIWDEQGACSQQRQTKGFHKKEPCLPGAPGIVLAEDTSIIISSIPETGFKNTLEFRMIKAVAFVFGAFFSGVWMLRPHREKSRTDILHYYGVKFTWLVIAMLFIYQFYLINSYSVDVPIVDEWIYFASDGLINGFSLHWLFGAHSDHRIVLTKLITWMNLKLFDLNFALQDIIDFFLFGLLFASIVLFKNKVLGRGESLLFPLFMIYLLSPIDVENHMWSFQSQIHLVMLFSVLMLCHVYGSKLTIKSALLFSLYAILAMYTFAAGTIFVVVYLSSVVLYTVSGIIGNRIDSSEGWRYLLILCCICGVSLCLWFFGYEPADSVTPNIYPSDYRFWIYFLNIISFGFGFESLYILPGIVCLLLAVFPIILLLLNNETRWQRSTWLVLSAVSGILAVLASISFGRANLDWSPKISRYSEIGFMLIPYSALGWWLAIKERFQRIAMLSFLWLFCFAAYFDDWSSGDYAMYKQSNLYDLEYIEAYYSGAGNDIVPFRSTAADLDRARLLGVSFTRQFPLAGGK